jgi:integrase
MQHASCRGRAAAALVSRDAARLDRAVEGGEAREEGRAWRAECRRPHAASPAPARQLAKRTRMGETLGIEWRHIDFDAGLVSIEQQANARRQLTRVKTASGVRTIEAPDWLIAMFRQLGGRTRYAGVSDLVYARRPDGRTTTATSSAGASTPPSTAPASRASASTHSATRTRASGSRTAATSSPSRSASGTRRRR